MSEMLELRHISKTFGAGTINEKKAVEDLSLTLASGDFVTIIGGNGDTDNGVSTIAGNVPVVMAKLFESMKETTGVDLAEIMKADTYDAKVTRNVNLTGAPDIILGSETGQNSSGADQTQP